MSKATIKRLLTVLSSKGEIEQAQLYQLVQAAERCYCLKYPKGQYELGAILKNYSFPFNLVGEYYQTLYLYLQGQKDTALGILEEVRSHAPHKYQDKSLLTMGGIYELEGDLDEAMKVRLAATKSDILPVVLDAALGISALLGMQGKHDKAVEYLEGILPLTSKLGPVPLSFDLFNSYAVELSEQGKTEEAMKVIIPVVNSPYTPFYPNWPDTQKEIREKSSRRSMVAMNRSNVIEFPTKEKEEPEEQEETVEEPKFPYENYISEKFGLRDKVEDWMYGQLEINEFGTLMVVLAETRDSIERDMILEQVIDTTFPLTPQGQEAKRQWRQGIISKITE